MGRKRKVTGSIKCRYPGCAAKFGSMNGRAAHERKEHGNLFSKQIIPDEKPAEDIAPISPVITTDEKSNIESETNEDSNFIKVSEVRFKMAKNTKKPKIDEELENECGKCGYEFNGTFKYCPECGVEFA